MRLLLDECVPRKFRSFLPGHDCRTVPEEDLADKKNGELRSLAEKLGFQVFLTPDPGLEYEQKLQQRNISVILIRSKSSCLADLSPHSSEILRVLRSIPAQRTGEGRLKGIASHANIININRWFTPLPGVFCRCSIANSTEPDAHAGRRRAGRWRFMLITAAKRCRNLARTNPTN